MKDKIKTKLNILLLVFMLSLTGCKTENQERKIANLNYEEMLNENTSQISIDNVIYTNNYEEYKNYLSNLNPSYDLLRRTDKTGASGKGRRARHAAGSVSVTFPSDSPDTAAVGRNLLSVVCGVMRISFPSLCLRKCLQFLRHKACSSQSKPGAWGGRKYLAPEFYPNPCLYSWVPPQSSPHFSQALQYPIPGLQTVPGPFRKYSCHWGN